MNDILDIEIILKRKKYPIIYNIGIILTIILLAIIYIIFTYKYQTYYKSKAKMIDNKLELLINIEDLKYINNNDIIIIDDKKYNYNLDSIDGQLYVDENYKNYKYVYLKVTNLNNINNYVYEIKIPKENKILAKYLKEYL